jgi:Flp pilus assembly protein TadG
VLSVSRAERRAPTGLRRSVRERGTVTAEFATVVPAVILVLVCCLGAVHLAGQRLRLQDAAADAARILARGDPAVQRAEALMAGSVLSRRDSDGMVCATLRAPAAVAGGLLGDVTLTATSCALAVP